MTIYDISVPLSPLTPVWPDEPGFTRKEIRKGENSDIIVSQFSATLHSGTHVDAPRHFVPQGRAIDEFELERFIGPARVVETEKEQIIRASDLDPAAWAGATRVLFKTSNSNLWEQKKLDKNFTGLHISAARLLRESGVKLVGIDYLSIEPYGSPQNPVHRHLMSHDVLILEGLNLSHVKPGDYRLVCLPLKVAGGEASPVRAILESMD